MLSCVSDENSKLIALRELEDLDFLKDGKVLLIFFQAAKTSVIRYLKNTGILRSMQGWFIICYDVICDIIRAQLLPKLPKNSARVSRDYPLFLFVFVLFPNVNTKLIPIDAKLLQKNEKVISFLPNICLRENYNQASCLFNQR